jgi:hypothetical protein
MIEFPDHIAPNGASMTMVDFGGVQRPPLGGALLKVDRPGSRYRAALSFPPMVNDSDGRIFVSRLIRAKRLGLRVPYPLLDQTQGIPGAPVVNGAGQSGTTLNVRGMTPNYPGREGFWLSVVDASGQHYLHNAAGAFNASAGGLAAIPLSEPLRTPFPDGAVVHLARPMIEGIVSGNEQSWTIALERFLQFSVELEEAA